MRRETYLNTNYGGVDPKSAEEEKAKRIWVTDRQGIRWIADKNGDPIKYNQALIGEDGKRYEIYGTGMYFGPQADGSHLFWTHDNRLVWRNPKTMRCTISEGEEGFLTVLATLFSVLFVAFFLHLVGAL